MPDINERMRPPPADPAPEPTAAAVAHLVSKIKAADAAAGDGMEQRLESLIEKKRATSGVTSTRQSPLPRDLDPAVPRALGVAAGVDSVDGGQQ